MDVSYYANSEDKYRRFIAKLKKQEEKLLKREKELFELFAFGQVIK